MSGLRTTDPNFHRSVYLLLAILSLSGVAGRIASVRSDLGKSPLLGANDRSRWSTVRALVDHGTYAIDDVILPNGRRDREWYSIDMVRHRGRDGREHYYSSKPPLLATLVAGPYWVLRQVSGIRFGERPFYVGRILLVITNLIPLACYFLLLAILIERYGESDWARMFVYAAGTCGTFLTTFAVTLNNHLPAAISVAVALYAALEITRRGSNTLFHYGLAGLASAFAVTNELPALSFFACLAVWLAWHSPGRWLAAFIPTAAVVALAFFATNWVAHDSWRPPYAHRQDGPVLAEIELPLPSNIDTPQATPLPPNLRQALPLELSPSATIQLSDTANRWILWDPDQQQRWALVVSQDQDGRLELREWDDWYEYERSYWIGDRRRGVDLGERSRLVYAFHATLGHRGILSLTPVWWLSLIGLCFWLAGPDRNWRLLASGIILLTTVCLTFYFTRPQIDRNYGGVASGFRWMFWFTPLWLMSMLPAADRCAPYRGCRGVAWVLLAVSVFSAVYPWDNPWSHSWIFDYWTELGWLKQR